jgi:hypothetical protein
MLLKDYHTFFKLYQTAPNMGQYVMDFFTEKIRWYTVKAMTKAYGSHSFINSTKQMRGVRSKQCFLFSVNSFRPTIPVTFIQEELGFDSVEECETFLKERGAAFVRKENKLGSKLKIDTKNSYVGFVNWEINKEL